MHTSPTPLTNITLYIVHLAAWNARNLWNVVSWFGWMGFWWWGGGGVSMHPRGTIDKLVGVFGVVFSACLYLYGLP